MEHKEQSIENSNWISLADDENVLAWSHPSVYKYLPQVLMSLGICIAGILSPIFMFDTIGYYGLLLIPLGILMAVYEYVRYATVFYVFTDRRVITKRGLLSHDVRKVRYENIDKKDKDYPLIGRILGYGRLKTVTATPDQADIYMRYLPELNEASTIIANNTGNDDNAGDLSQKKAE